MQSERPILSLGVLGSGSGSNLQAIFDAIDEGRLAALVRCVLCDVEDAGILERARAHGISAYFVACGPSRTTLEADAGLRVLDLLQTHGVQVVALAGFMRMVKGRLLHEYAGRMVNVHPSLLPAFPGLKAWEQAFDYGAKITGCTVHFVDAGMDTGPIISQRAVPVLPEDTPAVLHRRIQEQEHRAYPEALQWMAEGRVRRDGRRVLVDGLPPAPRLAGTTE